MGLSEWACWHGPVGPPTLAGKMERQAGAPNSLLRTVPCPPGFSPGGEHVPTTGASGKQAPAASNHSDEQLSHNEQRSPMSSCRRMVYDLTWGPEGRYLLFTADYPQAPGVFAFDRRREEILHLAKVPPSELASRLSLQTARRWPS